MAWLHATPKPDERSRRAKTEQGPAISRLDRMKADGVSPQMPPNPAPHIVERLIEIGLTEAAGMGVGPLSWLSINEWQRAACVRLDPWEAKLIRRLSIEYVAEGRRAEKETCPPPWHREVTQREREIEQKRLQAVLG